jgi:argininosuccinate synthase
VDRNLWGQSIDCACLRLDAPVPEDVFTYSVSPQKSPDLPTELELDFQGGLPVAMDGRKMPLVQLIQQLNVAAGACGLGRRESVEDRLVGFKSREVYDAPAAETLYAAKKALERNVLSREALAARKRLAEDYGRCVYEGHWFGLLREALDAFFLRLNLVVEGKVRLQLFKGVCRVMTVHSNFSLIPTQNPAASFFSRADAEGFIHLHTFTPILEGRQQNRDKVT